MPPEDAARSGHGGHGTDGRRDPRIIAQRLSSADSDFGGRRCRGAPWRVCARCRGMRAESGQMAKRWQLRCRRSGRPEPASGACSTCRTGAARCPPTVRSNAGTLRRRRQASQGSRGPLRIIGPDYASHKHEKPTAAFRQPSGISSQLVRRYRFVEIRNAAGNRKSGESSGEKSRGSRSEARTADYFCA